MSGLDRQLIKAQVMEALFGEAHDLPRIGRFVVHKREAAGSMGEVYVAYDEELAREVALKLLRTEGGLDTEAAAKRSLLREARTLAAMPHHRNLVQIHEAGLYHDQVFLAMEYVRGRTLREWLADRRQISRSSTSQAMQWRTVLAAMAEAGRGLEAAHSAGVVHRDFKPDNVIVGNDGRICVIDFGLARSMSVGSRQRDEAAAAGSQPSTAALEPARLDGHATATSTVAGTPAYMSPEQLRGEPADARSDQFSFCVVLYEALYGTRPFDGDDLGSLRDSVLAGRCAAPPRDSPVPRRIWKVIERGLSATASERHESMRAVLTAMLRDPARQRRRIALGVSLLGVGLLIGVAVHRATSSAPDPCMLAGSGVSSIWNPAIAAQAAGAFHASARSYGAAAWDLTRPGVDHYAAALAAERKAACIANQVRHELSDDLFTRRMLCLDRRERHFAALAGELVKADSSMVEKAAASVADLPSIEICRDDELLATNAGATAAGDSRVAKELHTELVQAHIQRISGHLRESRQSAEAALAVARSTPGSPLLAEALYEAGAIWRVSATAIDVTRAEEALSEAADLAESQRTDELLNEIWLELVRLADNHPRQAAVAHLYARRALATSDRLHSARSRMIVLGLLGSLYYREGDYVAAEQYEDKALALALASSTGASRLEIANVWNQIGYIRVERQRFDGARSAYQQALELSRSELGPNHPRIAALSYNFAIFCRTAVDLSEARRLDLAAQKIWIDALGARNIYVAGTYLDLALVEIEAGDLNQAENYAVRAREILAEVAPDRPETASPEIRLGLVAFRRGRFEDALHAFERGLAIRERTGAPAKDIALAALAVAETLVELGRIDEALGRISQLDRGPAGAAHASPTVQAALDKVAGLARLSQGDRAAALPPLERALAVLEREPVVSLEQADVKWAVARALPRGHSRACALAEAARNRYLQLGSAGTPPSGAIARWLASTGCASR